MKTTNNYASVVNKDSNKEVLSLIWKSIVTGLGVGGVISLYRFILVKAEHFSFAIFKYAKINQWMVPVVFLALFVSAWILSKLTEKWPMISGSGIPQVKGIIMGYFKNDWKETMIAKFIGGSIAIISGLSLGREGPSIQLGACIGEGVGEKFASTRTEKKILIASGASAGLAAAFNAPLAGVMFAIEEIFRYFSASILLATMVSAIVADFVSKLFFGMEPIFEFEVMERIPLSGYWILGIMGIFLGIGGTLYNKYLIKLKSHAKKMQIKNNMLPFAMPFMMAGIAGFFLPQLLGGGHAIVSFLSLESSFLFLMILLIFKFIYSIVSFSSGSPGGIFFPLLVLGAMIGAMIGIISVRYLGYDESLFYNFVIIAMAGFFTAIVRAPLTGVILLTEMTGSFSHLLSLSFVSLIAYVVAELLQSAPIYESLLELQIEKEGESSLDKEYHSKIVIEFVAHHGSYVENKLVKDIQLPEDCLLIAIRRRGKDIIPKGNTQILAGDYLIVLTHCMNESIYREALQEMTVGF